MLPTQVAINCFILRLGHFHAAENKDNSVLAITSSADDVYLITGDTSGFVTVWNIEDYCTTEQGEVRNKKINQILF